MYHDKSSGIWWKNRNAWQSPAWLARSCDVGATWWIRLNDQAACTLRRLLNSSREDGSNDCPVQIQYQHKKSSMVAIPNSFGTVLVPIADAEWMKSICSVKTGVGVGLPLPGVTVTGPPGRVAATGQWPGPVHCCSDWASGVLPGLRWNSRPKAYQNYPNLPNLLCASN